jgi:Zn-dependent protease with chaperone function
VSERFFAWRFDGRTAEAHPASLWLDGADLVVHSGGAERRMPFTSARISEPFERTPRMLYTADGESYEIDDGPGFSRVLEARGAPVSPVVRLQRHAPASAAALALLIAAFVGAYVYGVPLLARWAARQTPYAAQQRLGAQALALLDQTFLEPSRLSEDLRATIAARFLTAADIAAPGRGVRLEFRRYSGDPDPELIDPGDPDAPHHGMINALSLPGGTIVLLDGLVSVANMDEVFGVLGHELGHVALGHSMQSFYRNAGVAALAGLAWGDFSGIAAGVPAMLGMLRYSRQLEDEADDYAVRFITLEGLDASALCSFFEFVLNDAPQRVRGGLPEFVSTHPDPSKRIARLCPERASNRASSP